MDTKKYKNESSYEPQSLGTIISDIKNGRYKEDVGKNRKLSKTKEPPEGVVIKNLTSYTISRVYDGDQPKPDEKGY